MGIGQIVTDIEHFESPKRLGQAWECCLGATTMEILGRSDGMKTTCKEEFEVFQARRKTPLNLFNRESKVALTSNGEREQGGREAKVGDFRSVLFDGRTRFRSNPSELDALVTRV